MQTADFQSIGYLDYPRIDHRPQPGTEAEIDYSKGWAKAQFEETNHSEIDDDFLAGRNTYAVDYWHGA